MPSQPDGWLDPEQQRAWHAFTRLHLRMSYEMNKQLQAESAVSLADFHVLDALANAPGGTTSITALAGQIGWERSRASHHVKRMVDRGLVRTASVAHDRRITELSLTAAGREALAAATPGHVDLVRRVFFDGLDPQVVERLAESLETVYDNVARTTGRP